MKPPGIVQFDADGKVIEILSPFMFALPGMTRPYVKRKNLDYGTAAGNDQMGGNRRILAGEILCR